MDLCAGCGHGSADELPRRWLDADLGLMSVRAHDSAGCWAAARARHGGRFLRESDAEPLPRKARRLVADDRVTLA